MHAYVNDRRVELVQGMTVRHALIASGHLADVDAGKIVRDEWGNPVGLDGALSEGAKIYVR